MIHYFFLKKKKKNQNWHFLPNVCISIVIFLPFFSAVEEHAHWLLLQHQETWQIMVLVATDASTDLVCDNTSTLYACSLLYIVCSLFFANSFLKTTLTKPISHTIQYCLSAALIHKKVSTRPPCHPCFSWFFCLFVCFKPSSCQVNNSSVSVWDCDLTPKAMNDACTHTCMHTHALSPWTGA